MVQPKPQQWCFVVESSVMQLKGCACFMERVRALRSWLHGANCGDEYNMYAGWIGLALLLCLSAVEFAVVHTH